MSIHSFIHSGHFYFKSSTTQRRSRLQDGYCVGVSRRSAQATAGKGLAQGPYVAPRAGVEPTTLRLKVMISTKAPPRPTRNGRHMHIAYMPRFKTRRFLDIALEVKIGKTGFRFCNSSNQHVVCVFVLMFNAVWLI